MSWKTFNIGELCRIEKGITGIKKAIPGKYPLVVTGEERKSHNEYQFDDEAVIIPLVSSTGHGHKSLKRIHFQTGKFALGSILCAVIPKDKNILNAQYLFYFLDLNKENELVSRMKGMANVSLPIKEIATLEILVPPIKEQLKFIERYKHLESINRKLSVELSTQSNFLTQLRQSFLREAMQGKLVKQDPKDGHAKDLLAKIKAEKAKSGKKEKELPPIRPEEIPFEIPENWVWCRLGEIAEIGTGATPLSSNNNYYNNGTISWITSAATNSFFVNKAEFYITEKALKDTNCKVFPKGTLVVAMYGQGKTRGQITELNIDAATNQACAAILLFLKNESLKKFVKYYFRKIYNELRDLAQGGSQPNLNMGKIKNTILPLPPIKEQISLVNELDNLMNLCDELQISLETSKDQNNKLLQQLLKEALNPHDNP